MSEENPDLLNFSQKIVNLLDNNWGMSGVDDSDNIYFVGYKMNPNNRFKSGGKNIVIEIFPVSGVGNKTSLSTTKINDLISINLWIKVTDSTDLARKDGENQRARFKKNILDIIETNQLKVTGIEINVISNFLDSDEVETSPVILHSAVSTKTQWFHHSS